MYIGNATIYQNNQEIPIKIIRHPGYREEMIFCATLANKESELGSITTEHLKSENTLFIHNLRAYPLGYKGVGSALMQAAMEFSYKNGCEGNISLDAMGDSHEFYHKIGLRAKKNTGERIIECGKKLLKNSGKRGFYKNSNDFYRMILPKDSIEAWRAYIRCYPIFSETKEFLPTKSLGLEESKKNDF